MLHKGIKYFNSEAEHFVDKAESHHSVILYLFLVKVLVPRIVIL